MIRYISSLMGLYSRAWCHRLPTRAPWDPSPYAKGAVRKQAETYQSSHWVIVARHHNVAMIDSDGRHRNDDPNAVQGGTGSGSRPGGLHSRSVVAGNAHNVHWAATPLVMWSFLFLYFKLQLFQRFDDTGPNKFLKFCRSADLKRSGTTALEWNGNAMFLRTIIKF